MTDGLHARVRHPRYLQALLALIGWVLVAHHGLAYLLVAASVPVLVDGALTIQGSGEILDYLERRIPEAPLTPADPAAAEACADWYGTLT